MTTTQKQSYFALRSTGLTSLVAFMIVKYRLNEGIILGSGIVEQKYIPIQSVSRRKYGFQKTMIAIYKVIKLPLKPF
jgi:hypothetical protein